MGLQADAVDGHAALLEVLNQGLHGKRLVADRLHVVVVVVQLRPRRGVLAREAERVLDIRGTQGFEPNIATQGAIVVEGLVHDVPRVAVVVVVRSLVLDVVLHYTEQLALAPRLARQPVRELVVPDEVVAAAQLARLLGGDHDLVAEGVVEDVAGGLDVDPFLAVGRGDLVKFGLVEGEVGVLLVVEDHVVDGRAKVLQPCFLG